MKRFPLHSVLGYRENLEDMAQLSLARARQEYQSVMERKQAEEKRLLEVRQEFAKHQARGMDGMSLALYQQCLDSILHGLQTIQSELDRAEQKVEDEKKALHKASTDKKKLEKLKERHESRAREEDKRLETAMLDDVAVCGWGRGRL